MHEADFSAFSARLDSVCRLLSAGRYTPAPGEVKEFFTALRAYPLQLVDLAFDAHVGDPVNGRFVPKPSDLIAKLQARAGEDGRPGPEEAWAIAMRAADERETVVWTSEIAQAFDIARSVLDAGDEVGARMAFRESYDRLVAAARRAGQRVQWSASMGSDPGKRFAVLEAAAQIGRATAQHELLCAPSAPDDALLLEGPAEHKPVPAPERARAALQQLRDRLAGAQTGPSADALARAETQRRKDEIAGAVRAAAGDAGLDLKAGPWMSPGEVDAMLSRVRQGDQP